MAGLCAFRSCGLRQTRQAAFTLIELIAVIVILAICSVVGAGFMANMTDQYQKAQLRADLVSQGSVVMEQLTRHLRMAVPNSVRISSSGACLEYLPLIGGTFYETWVPDSENGQSPISVIDTLRFTLSTAPKHYVIAPVSPDEIYTLATPSARASAGTLGAAPYDQAVLASAHRFLRNSITRRLLIANDPVRFCVQGDRLWRYQGYGLTTSAMSDVSPGGEAILLASSVQTSGAVFSLLQGSENRNAALEMQLAFTGGTESVRLRSRVLIRNLP